MEYRDTHFIIGVELEKSTDATYSGLNTKASDLIGVTTLWDKSIPSSKLPLNMYVVMTTDFLIEFRDSGVHIFDWKH